MKARKQCRYRLLGWVVTVRICRTPPNELGYCSGNHDTREATIVIREGLSLPETVNVLSHELSHLIDMIFEEKRAEASGRAMAMSSRGLGLFTEDD